ncbi:MAG: bifunctional proline dehydrogenase/L-glutamate gamma-semialdehyde dehydrogenase PutA, partial [Pseudomonadota bacterium]
MDSATSRLRALHRAQESVVLKPLVEQARSSPEERGRVVTRATGLLVLLRDAQGSGWVNQFLNEYRLNTSEGVALLSLAEAFLRVPDTATADGLIADKLGDANWRAHTGKSDSALVNSATWGLVIGRALVSEREEAGV